MNQTEIEYIKSILMKSNSPIEHDYLLWKDKINKCLVMLENEKLRMNGFALRLKEVVIQNEKQQ